MPARPPLHFVDTEKDTEVTDLLKNARDMTPAEYEEGLRQIARDDFRRLYDRSPPDYLKDRHAASLSPKEMDDYRKAMGIDRSHWSDVDRQQARWAKDPAAVAAREADIARVARLVAERGDKP